MIGLVRGADDEDAYLQVDWNLFDTCVLLRQLPVSRLSVDQRTWLNTVLRSVTDLIVTDQYAFCEFSLKQFVLLRLPNLKYIFTREIIAERKSSMWSVTNSGSGLVFMWDSESDSGMDPDVESETRSKPESASGTIAGLDLVANTDVGEE